jgi:hypothetical protein
VRHLRGALLLAVGLAACDAPRPASPGLWTLFDVQDLYASGAQPTDAIAIDAGLPGGIKLGTMLDSSGTLFEHPTLTEGYESRYMTTEVWTHFDEIWVQPLYIPVIGWQAGNRTPVGGGSWIFSVGQDSLFYSPFWQVIYVNVPDGTTVETLRSVRDVLDSGYSLHPGPGRTVSLVPAVSPPRGTLPVPGEGWLDGQRQAFLDFGGATIEWDADGVIKETPIYVPVYRTAGGELKRLGITTIAASGPRGSNLFAPPFVENQPRYAAYWRVFLVVIPPPNPSLPATVPNVTVFAPPGGTGLYEQLMADGFPVVADYAQPIKDALAQDSAAYATYEGRVSLKPLGPNGRPECFDDPTLFPADANRAGCGWLGSQNEIEMFFDASQIIRTDVTVTCPVVHSRMEDLIPVGLK